MSLEELFKLGYEKDVSIIITSKCLSGCIGYSFEIVSFIPTQNYKSRFYIFSEMLSNLQEKLESL